MIKLKDVNFSPIIPENPISTRDQLMKECWAEIKGLPKPVFDNVWQGPIEVRVEELKIKMKKFEEKVEKLKDQYLEEQKKKAESEANKADKKKAKTATPAAPTTATPKKVLNPNFVKIEGGETTTDQGSEKKQPQVLQYKPKEKGEESKDGDSDDQEQPEKEAEDKPDSDMDFDSEELDDEYFEMNEEEKKAYKQKRDRIKQAKIEDFKRRDNF